MCQIASLPLQIHPASRGVWIDLQSRRLQMTKTVYVRSNQFRSHLVRCRHPPLGRLFQFFIRFGLVCFSDSYLLLYCSFSEHMISGLTNEPGIGFLFLGSCAYHARMAIRIVFTLDHTLEYMHAQLIPTVNLYYTSCL